MIRTNQQNKYFSLFENVHKIDKELLKLRPKICVASVSNVYYLDFLHKIEMQIGLDPSRCKNKLKCFRVDIINDLHQILCKL